MTHTPGPWRVAAGENGAILAPSASGQYTQVVYFDGNGYVYQSPGDAVLIAAAPEMLAALKDAAEIIKDLDWWASDEAKSALIKARAAIAKATGAQS